MTIVGPGESLLRLFTVHSLCAPNLTLQAEFSPPWPAPLTHFSVGVRQLNDSHLLPQNSPREVQVDK